MAKEPIDFDTKRQAICLCCGGWKTNSREQIEAKWLLMPEQRRLAYLHRLGKLKGEGRKKFIESLPKLPAPEESKAEAATPESGESGADKKGEATPTPVKPDAGKK